MGSILERFGVSAKLLRSDLAYKRLTENDQDATTDQIRQAVRGLAPVGCGIPLIRIGPDRDGGYLIPDDLSGIEACFSPGTNNFKDFEDRLANTYGIKSFICDFSSDVEKFRTPLIDGLQFFQKKGLDVNGSETSLDINEWVKQNASESGDLILQMDIGGAEYRNILHATHETLSRFRIIVIEIHFLDLLSKQQFLFGMFNPIFEKIGKLFGCVHAHPNNCCGNVTFGDGIVVPKVLELTFLRKDRFKARNIPLELPHVLDRSNVPSNVPLHVSGVLRDYADSISSDINGLKQTVQWLERRLLDLETKATNAELNAELTNFLTLHLAGEKNIAKGKTATQSSTAPHSDPEGANGAINGIKTGRFGFHTNIENNPWWQLDLGEDYELEGILVYNRLDAAQCRIRALRILVSRDAEQWSVVYEHKMRPPFGGVRPYNGVPPLLVRLNGLRSRYIKLESPEKTALHLDEVEVYGASIGQ